MSPTTPLSTYTTSLSATILPLWPLLALLALLIYTTWTLAITFRPSLSRIPGPTTARFSRLYLMYHATRGDFHMLYRGLHDKYGPLVRVGPNKISVADPGMIAAIYGVNSAFVKVCGK